MILDVSAMPMGTPESIIGSNAGGSGALGMFAGRAGTGGKLSSTFNDGRRLVVGLLMGVPDSELGTGGTGRVGRDGVLERDEERDEEALLVVRSSSS